MSMNFKIKSWFSFFVLWIAIFMISFIYLFIPLRLNQEKTVLIPQKSSVSKIICILRDAEVIQYPRFFYYQFLLYSLVNTLKSGEYRFAGSISPIEILNTLSQGKSVIHKFIFPEGITVHEIISKINSERLLTGDIDDILVKEGTLMPSTYFFVYGDSRVKLLQQMQSLMTSNLNKLMRDLKKDSPLKTQEDVLILASIVEKEAKFDHERPMIARVFLNRLKQGMKLQADPTTIYAITQGKFKLETPLLKKDLFIKSLYNTYYISGLPPTPISCPGIKSLEAVVKPANSAALYFVADGKGRHNFADNLIQHNENVKRYKNSQN